MCRHLTEDLLNEIAEVINRRFTLTPKVAILGFGNAGKSALFNALYGKEVAPVSMATDTTQEAATSERFGVDFTDTPGFGTAAFSLDSLMESGVLDQQHLVLHVLNAASCITEADEKLHNILKDTTTTVITVVNKSDLLDETQRKQFTESLQEKLDLDSDDVPFVSALKGTGIPELAQRIADTLPEAVRDAFIAQQQADELLKERRIRALTYSKACVCAAIAATPIPVADLFILTPIQVALITSIGYLRGVEISEKRALELLSVLGSGIGLRSIARQLLKLVPGYGSAINASVAFAGTVALGEAANTWYKSGMTVGVEHLREVFEESAEEARKDFGNFADKVSKARESIDELEQKHSDGTMAREDTNAALRELDNTDEK